MRAEYVPTDAQRSLVENAAAFGLTQAEIANQLKIDEKTLRKHFRGELSSGKFKVYPRAAHWLGLDQKKRAEPADAPRNSRRETVRSLYCHECIERFTMRDVRCSYGTRFFHKECYKRWGERKMFQCG